MIIEEINVCNEMNSVVLNYLLLFFYKKISHAPKSTKITEKHQTHKKAQKRNQAKA